MSTQIELSGQDQVARLGASLPWKESLSELPAEPLEWKPGNMPEACYQGIWAHYLIGLHYRQANEFHDVMVDYSVARILRISTGATYPGNYPRIRPDLFDRSWGQGEIWEIKPSGSAGRAGLQTEVYRNQLGYGLDVRAGRAREGTEGKVFAPGGHIGFGVRFDGVIRYDYIRHR